MSKLKRFVEDVVAAAAAADTAYAIGGGVAVRAHGYKRETSDVDAFFPAEAKPAVLRYFRQMGYSVEGVMRPFMYVAIPEDATNIEERVDLLFPETDPEISAIEMAQSWRVEGVAARVFPSELLALTKLVYSDRWQDVADVAELLELGAFDPKEARRLLSLFDPDEVSTFDERLAALKIRPRGRPRKRRK